MSPLGASRGVGGRPAAAEGAKAGGVSDAS